MSAPALDTPALYADAGTIPGPAAVPAAGRLWQACLWLGAAMLAATILFSVVGAADAAIVTAILALVGAPVRAGLALTRAGARG